MKKTLTVRAGKDDAVITMVEWRKNVGDTIRAKEVIAIAALSKAEVDVESSEDGVLVERCAEAEDIVPRPDDAAGDWDAVVGWIETGAVAEKVDVIEASEEKVIIPKHQDDFIRAYPHVRTIAHERGVDLARVKGSGPEGIILLKDLDGAAKEPSNIESRDQIMRRLGADYVIAPLGAVRKQIAKNMELSWRCIPHAATSVRVNFLKLIAARAKAQNSRKYPEIKKYLRYEVVVIDAMLNALVQDFRKLNACYGCEHLDFEGIKYFSRISLGVAFDRASGLLVPVLHHIENDNYGIVAERLDDLSRTMRENKITPDMFKDATITFNNVGAFRKNKDSTELIGSDDGKSIIPHGQSVICSLHHVETDETSPWYGLASLSASFDHRVHDGGIIIRFLNAVKEHIENKDFNSVLSYLV